ncbi:MAG: leucine-rich repeat protein, partial [Lachnospiraceae bacterium]|nr:leucine-rich repeat protein [Lachnospiraceae bacterium]
TGTDCAEAVLSREGGRLLLTLENVRYTRAVRLDVRRSDVYFTYDPNGGYPEGRVTVPVTPSHLRLNTAGALFSREGFTFTGWNTRADGSGTAVGPGSRADAGEGTVFYAQWAQWTDERLFAFEGGVISGYSGDADTLVIPASIRGEAVVTLKEGAFEHCSASTVVFPDSLRTVEPGAFRDASVRVLSLSDSLRTVSDYSFEGCTALETLRIRQSAAPVYAGTYYASFADKFDRLLALKDRRKIVLFSGSSARFGYDSAMIDRAFPDYEVVNMGVFAYSNALPQLLLIRSCMNPGDVLLLSPELDAAKRQFCTEDRLDAPFFSLAEADYGLVSRLDLRQFSLVFSSFQAYLSARDGMEKRSYALSPSDFDEDGNPAPAPSYNAYGDYVLYRPNAASDDPLYGLGVPYTPSYYRKEQYIDPFNRVMKTFTDAGIRVFMTYSPRNRQAVSADTTEDSIAALDAYFRANLEIPVISDIFESLLPGRWFYGTDNHLSTEGAARRTAQVIRDLAEALGEGGAP